MQNLSNIFVYDFNLYIIWGHISQFLVGIFVKIVENDRTYDGIN